MSQTLDSLLTAHHDRFIFSENCGTPCIELFLRNWRHFNTFETVYGVSLISVCITCDFWINCLQQVYLRTLQQTHKSNDLFFGLKLRMVYDILCLFLSMAGIYMTQGHKPMVYARVILMFAFDFFIVYDMLNLLWKVNKCINSYII